MRRKLLDALPTVTQEPDEPPAVVPLAERRRARRAAPARVLVAAAAALCVLLTLSGLSMLLAKDALPGDSLYEVKQLSERASLGLTFDEQDRARKHLQFADTRLTELQTLAGAGVTEPADYRTALRGLDTDAAEGARQFIVLGTGNDGAPLDELAQWVYNERTQLQALDKQLPDEVRKAATATTAMLDGIARRVSDLRDRLGCAVITSGATDRIGLLPAIDACAEGTADGNGGNAERGGVTPAPDRPGTAERGRMLQGGQSSGQRPSGQQPPSQAGPGGAGQGAGTADRPPARQQPNKPKPPRKPPRRSEPSRPPLNLPELPPLLPSLPGGPVLPGLLSP